MCSPAGRGGKNVFLSDIQVNCCNIFCQIQEILSEGHAHTFEEIGFDQMLLLLKCQYFHDLDVFNGLWRTQQTFLP